MLTGTMREKKSELSLDTLKLKKAALILRAINHPLRQKILYLIHQRGSMRVTDLYKTLDEEQSVTSLHLSILRKENYVSTLREGRSILYSVNYDRLKEVHEIIHGLSTSR